MPKLRLGQRLLSQVHSHTQYILQNPPEAKWHGTARGEGLRGSWASTNMWTGNQRTQGSGVEGWPGHRGPGCAAHRLGTMVSGAWSQPDLKERPTLPLFSFECRTQGLDKDSGPEPHTSKFFVRRALHSPG